MLWGVTVEAGGATAEVVEAARRELERFKGGAEVDGDRLLVNFQVEAPSAKRAARVALVIFGRVAGQIEPGRFELERLG